MIYENSLLLVLYVLNNFQLMIHFECIIRNLTTFLPIFQILFSRAVSETVRVSWPSGEGSGLWIIDRDI